MADCTDAERAFLDLMHDTHKSCPMFGGGDGVSGRDRDVDLNRAWEVVSKERFFAEHPDWRERWKEATKLEMRGRFLKEDLFGKAVPRVIGHEFESVYDEAFEEVKAEREQP